MRGDRSCDCYKFLFRTNSRDPLDGASLFLAASVWPSNLNAGVALRIALFSACAMRSREQFGVLPRFRLGKIPSAPGYDRRCVGGMGF
jgi:hypothetical protein